MWLSVGPLFTSTRFLPPRVQHWQHVVWHSFTAMDSIFYNPKEGTGSYTITSANQTSEWRPSHETSDIILVCNVKIGEKHTEATRRWKCRHFNGWDRRKENYLNEIQELAMGKLKKKKLKIVRIQPPLVLAPFYPPTPLFFLWWGVVRDGNNSFWPAHLSGLICERAGTYRHCVRV